MHNTRGQEHTMCRLGSGSATIATVTFVLCAFNAGSLGNDLKKEKNRGGQGWVVWV